MEVIVILIGASLLAAVGFLVAFLLALRSGQFDDLATPPIRMLFDSETDRTSDKNHRSVG